MRNNSVSYWNKKGKKYQKVWASTAKKFLSRKELNFIKQIIKKHRPSNILDFGVGNGRILECLVKVTNNSHIYGVDFSQTMIDLCKQRFKNIQTIRALYVMDVLRQRFPVKIKFDLITAIRVLKYNKNWKKILIQLIRYLSSNGMIIFTMPNRYSLERFNKFSINYYYSDYKEIAAILQKYKMRVLVIKTFSVLPSLLYNKTSNILFSKILICLDDVLCTLIGNYVGRILFFCAYKSIYNTNTRGVKKLIE
jgi:ubiquinone/menaquinone biosynthesis C-methylase UbiE